MNGLASAESSGLELLYSGTEELPFSELASVLLIVCYNTKNQSWLLYNLNLVERALIESLGLIEQNLYEKIMTGYEFHR